MRQRLDQVHPGQARLSPHPDPDPCQQHVRSIVSLLDSGRSHHYRMNCWIKDDSHFVVQLRNRNCISKVTFSSLSSSLCEILPLLLLIILNTGIH